MSELEQPGTSGLKWALPEPAAKFKKQKVQKIEKTTKLPQLTHTLANPEPGTSGLKRPLHLQQSAAKIKKQKVQKKRGPKKKWSVIYLYNCFWALPEQSLLSRSPAELTVHIVLSRLTLSQPGGPGSRIYIPQEQGGPVTPLGSEFHFCRLLRLAGTTVEVL
jgi:hypothetical protein